MTADATERLAVIGTDPAACARLVEALTDAKVDEHGVLDASPLAHAVLRGHAPTWPTHVFFVLIGPVDGRPDPATATTTLRTALFACGVEHAVVSGRLDDQLSASASTWRARQSALRLDRAGPVPRGPKWRHACGRCGDGECEARLFELASSGDERLPFVASNPEQRQETPSSAQEAHLPEARSPR